MFHILYVDDEPGLLEIGKLFLETDNDFTVDTVTTAPRALSLLESTRYDAIVSDYQMPKMDGLTFLKALRASGNTIPFIIFTGRGREEVVIDALNSGADFYMQKGGEPVSQFAELAHKIHHAISRKRADLALQKSEHDYRHLIEHASEAIFITQDEVFQLVNPQLIKLTGYSEQELLNHPFTRFVHSDDADLLLDQYRKRIAGFNHPSHHIFRIICKDETLRWVELNVVSITWNERPAILNFLTDISERKLSDDSLRESEERYRQFFRTTLDGLFITTPEGKWIDFNDAVVEMFGYTSREEIFGRPIISFYVHPEERVSFIELLERHGYVKEHPVSLRKQDDTVFDSIMTVVPQRNPDGSTRAFIGTIRDISERKHTEESLRESEERYRQFFKATLDCVFITTPDGHWIDFNDALMESLGDRSREETFASTVASIYAHPEERAAFLEEVTRVGYIKERPFQFRKREGTIVDALITILPQKNPDGSTKAFIGTVRDITERKLAENALRQSEERYRLIFESFDDLYYQTDAGGCITVLSPSLYRVTGWRPEELIGAPVTKIYANPESRKDLLDALAKDGQVRDFEVLVVKRDGTETIASLNANLLRDANGTTTGVAGLLRDITRRRRDEEDLRESQEQFRSLVEYALEGILIVDLQGTILFANKAAARTIEIDGGEADLAGRNVMEFIAPESRPDVMRDFAEVARGHDAYLVQYQVITSKGNRIFVESIGKTVTYAGKTADLLSIRDITGRRIAEDALKESEEKYRLLIDSSQDPIFSFYPDGTYRYVNQAFAEGVGKPVDQITGRKIWDVFPRDEAEKRFSVLSSVFSTGVGRQFEVRVPRSDGDRYYVTSVVPIRDKKGAVTSAICSSKEITDRKRAEQAVQESEEKYRLLIENSHDIIYTMTPAGDFLFISPSVTTLLGYPVPEMVGKNIRQFIHPEDMPRCLEILKTTIDRGIPQQEVEYRIRYADGSWRWHVSKTVPLRDKTGTITGFEGISSDISGRKRAEDALRQANQKLSLLSGITRHDIKNQLLILRSYLTLMETMHPDAGVRDYLRKVDDSAQRINTMIQFTKDYDEIGVRAPSWQDIHALVNTAAMQVPLGRIVVKNILPSRMEVFADPLIAKVFYNLMDNAVRYGGKITAIRFSVQEGEGNLIIVCEDDGNGVVAEEKVKIFERGFGKNTGLGLALSREILAITGITMIENGEPGTGARFELIVPAGNYRSDHASGNPPGQS
ncbi:MAG: PAS domain S-box protein [Methanoregula sp.]